MFEFQIEVLNKKFEEIKEDVNNGKLLLYAEWELEDLIDEAKELKSLIKSNESIEALNSLLKKLSQYLCEIQCLIEQGVPHTL